MARNTALYSFIFFIHYAFLLRSDAFYRQHTASCPSFDAYAKLHWRIRFNQIKEAERKWIVAADDDGLADRLVNAVAAFYVALLTDRALCIIVRRWCGLWHSIPCGSKTPVC